MGKGDWWPIMRLEEHCHTLSSVSNKSWSLCDRNENFSSLLFPVNLLPEETAAGSYPYSVHLRSRKQADMASFQEQRPMEPVATPQKTGEKNPLFRFWKKKSKPLAKTQERWCCPKDNMISAACSPFPKPRASCIVDHKKSHCSRKEHFASVFLKRCPPG